MYRKIYKKLMEWKNNNINKPLMLLGARQCGKTYILDEFCKNEFENYIYLNLFKREDIVEMYEMRGNSDEKFLALELMLRKSGTILFIDEIQESETLVSDLKYFCEEHSDLRIVCAGSLLGVKLKRFKKSFPVGKVTLIDMYPMDFEEFLIAIGKERYINLIEKCYINNETMLESIHKVLLEFYRLYLIIGGMPEAVLNFVNLNLDIRNYKDVIINDIIKSYIKDMKKYVVSSSETIKIEKIFKSIPVQIENSSKKFQYSLVDKGVKSRNYELPLDWLEASNIVNKCECVKLPDIPLKGFLDDGVFKMYLCDVGVLRVMLKIQLKDIYLDKLSLYKGTITENYVANQLIVNEFDLFYWKSEGIAEVDFLLYTDDGIIPVEVKSSENTQSKSLNVYINKYNPKYAIRISSKNFGFKNNIKSVPLYAVFCINKSTKMRF